MIRRVSKLKNALEQRQLIPYFWWNAKSGGRETWPALSHPRSATAQQEQLRDLLGELTFAVEAVTKTRIIQLASTNRADAIENLVFPIRCVGIEQVMSPLQKQAISLLDEIPGVDQRSAQNLLAEIGTDMTRFPSDKHLASWAGLCPGNNQSANRRKSSRCSEDNRLVMIKRVRRQLKALRPLRGKLLGGKLLVALDVRSGLYCLICSSFRPTVLTQYPRDQNSRPNSVPFVLSTSRWISTRMPLDRRWV